MAGPPKQITEQKNQQSGPTPIAAPYFPELYNRARMAMESTNNNPFMGDYVAQDTPLAQTAMSELLTNAQTNIGRGSADYLRMAEQTAKGDFLRPDSNPFIQGVANAAIKPVTQTFSNTVLPGIKDASIAGGAYGGARQDLQENAASDALTKQIGDITSNIFYQNYANERQNQVNAPQMLEAGYNLTNARGQQMMSLADLQRQMQQRVLDNQLQQYQGRQAAPWYGLGEMGNILTQGGFNQASGTSTKDNPAYEDPFTRALKMALGAAGTAAAAAGPGGFGLTGMPAGMLRR